VIEGFTKVARSLTGGHWWWGLAMSVVLCAGSLALVTFIAIGWPVDHFRRAGRRVFWAHRPPAIRILGLILKNLAGAILVVLGVIMALPGVPGQGALTALIGITLINFPGKTGLERRFIGRPTILRAVNRLRARFKRPPLELD
jgi:hypothetical protein